MFSQWMIPILAGVTVLNLGAMILALPLSRRMRLQKRLQDSDLRNQAVAGRSPVLANLGRITSAMGGKVSPALADKLVQAGFPHPAAASVYMGLKLFLVVVGLMLSLAIVTPLTLALPMKIFVVLAAAGVLFILPGVYVEHRRARRMALLRNILPDVVDLLEVSTAAGMGLALAWNALTDQIRMVCPLMADEMAFVNLETHLGCSQVEALRHMVRRTGVAELSSLVALIVQTERFGTGIADALRTFAISMRQVRSFTAQEKAEKIAVKMIFPMVGFLFPATVLVMVGPGFMSLTQALTAGPG